MKRILLPWLALIVTFSIVAVMPAGLKVPLAITCIVLTYVLFRAVASHE